MSGTDHKKVFLLLRLSNMRQRILLFLMPEQVENSLVSFFPATKMIDAIFMGIAQGHLFFWNRDVWFSKIIEIHLISISEVCCRVKKIPVFFGGCYI